MNNWEAINALSHIAVVSEYFLQITLHKTGRVLASDSSTGPVPTFFDKKEKAIYFSDCFLSSNWAKYQNHRLKAINASHTSFTIDLEKIVHPEGETISTKWEFFFTSEDCETCLGIGHPLNPNMPYNTSIGDFFDSSNSDNNELLDNILEDRLLGFWEFDLENKTDIVSQGLGQMLGYTQNELKETKSIPWQKHVHPEDFPSLVKDLKSHLQTIGNNSFKKEFRINPKSNKTIWALGFGKTIQWSESGHPIKILGCLFDISGRKKQEIWMREHHYFLKELAFEQSHSLRARVANILGILEIMDAEPQNPESKQLIQLIKNETKLLDQSLKKSIKESVQKNKSIEKDLSIHSDSLDL